MKIKYSKFIPFKGFFAINLFGTLFVRDEYKDVEIKESTLTHESIHTLQMKEMGYIFFYIWYFIEWLIKLCIYGKNAYYHLSFEREAFNNEDHPEYLEERSLYSWFKYYNPTYKRYITCKTGDVLEYNNGDGNVITVTYNKKKDGILCIDTEASSYTKIIRKGEVIYEK